VQPSPDAGCTPHRPLRGTLCPVGIPVLDDGDWASADRRPLVLVP
jgi:hypothetical protein